MDVLRAHNTSPMSDDTTLKSYEDVPYDAAPEFETHPDTLGTLAYLHGMDPAPVARCRVLELGCATGGNLIPVALLNPDSTFVGIDLSPRQISQAQNVSAALNLKNTDFRAASITDVDPSWGQFDYVLCHGVYSWVPPFVQDKILDICAKNLSPYGVAYVSYNCYPGWRQRTVLRDLFKYRCRDIPDSRDKIAESRRFLAKLADSIPNDEGTYAKMLKEEVRILDTVRDTYILHEFLEDNNEPLHFHEFAARCAAHGLQYLSEASPWHGAHGRRAKMVESLLGRPAADVVELEQVLDFLVNRTFRRSLLVHADVALTRPMIPSRIRDTHVLGLARPGSEKPDLYTDKEEVFNTPYRTSVTTNSPMVKTALALANAVWPQPVPFPALAAETRRRLAENSPRTPHEDLDAHLSVALMQAYPGRLIELYRSPPSFSRVVSEKPEAFPFARIQAADGLPMLTNVMHRLVQVESDVDRLLISLLDGTRTPRDLAHALLSTLQRGDTQLTKDGNPVTDASTLQSFINEYLPDALSRFARTALLIR
jgi:methyltransferase-like protein/trans-aconitate methyltransferase